MSNDPARSPRRLDPLDLVIGIILALLIPILAYGAVRLARGDDSPQVEKSAKVPFDREEIDRRLAYIRRLYTDNALQFLARAKSADSRQQFDEMTWAERALDDVKARLGNLDFLIRDNGPVGREDKLGEIAALRTQVEGSLRELAPLDVLGVLRMNREG